MQLITGIQQAGIGVPNAENAKMLYKNLFGMNVKVFDDKAPATLMTQYTGNEVHHRHAILSMNLAGGGGLEIWQYTTREPVGPLNPIKPGDPGIFALKIKCRNIKSTYNFFKNSDCTSLSPVYISADDRYHFWLNDGFGNWFMIVESDDWFKKSSAHCGGVLGAVIGVSNMKEALRFYAGTLGIEEHVYNIKGQVDDLPGQYDSTENYHRVLLRKKPSDSGAFSKLLGGIEIELIQPLNRPVNTHIFHNRYWGDCGFIHLCFDVTDMDALKQCSEDKGYPFTVDSSTSFSMEHAAGRFCYVEDSDGTLIELVETHKVPVFKKIGWYVNLKKRKSNKPLPDWMINMLALSKIR